MLNNPRIVATVNELAAPWLKSSLASTANTRRLLDAHLAEALAPADARETEVAE